MSKGLTFFTMAGLILIILMGIFYNPNKKNIDDNISRIYELKIDSIKNEITHREQIVDSLNNIIIKNDSTINDLTSYISVLRNERVIIRKEYENRDEELKKMSNDSIVIFVRQQLLLWAEQ